MGKLIIPLNSKIPVWFSLPMASEIVKRTKSKSSMLRLLKDKKYLMNNNLPYQRYIKFGYFKIEEQPHEDNIGITNEVHIQTFVSLKGLRLIFRLIKKEKVAEKD